MEAIRILPDGVRATHFSSIVPASVKRRHDALFDAIANNGLPSRARERRALAWHDSPAAG
ncbi:hypothetical protein K788_0002972 [Paraburkholderia caribensis MBA4]|uniref:Uncharacterized protein n=1 Tax=Paraburkholderia caribensis MBA4 TaxID=1323664 RepID=A0A0P0RE71_9BURK|nr:hypothetical protein K788_0002972 [Paraburkholderia caribensis MBA4]